MSIYKINGTTTDALGAVNLRRSLTNQAADSVSFTLARRSFDAADLFPYNSVVTILKDSTTWFTGKVKQIPRSGSGTAEDMSYRIDGPWSDLEQLVYQQVWKKWDTTTEALEDEYSSKVILGQKLDGTALTATEQLTEIINYAASQGLPIAVGTIDIGITFPWSQETDLTCAEAIRSILRWMPDSAVWFDYSATPTTTINIKRRSALTAVAIDISNEEANTLNITARDDLKVPAVCLKYATSTDEEDNRYQTFTKDIYPVSATGREPGAAVATIELAGSDLSSSQQTQEIEVEALPVELNAASLATITDVAWWKTQLNWLDNDNISNISIHDMDRFGVAPAPKHYYPNILTKGTLHDWITSTADYDYMQVYIDYQVAQKDNTSLDVEEVKNQPVIIKFVATSVASNTYRNTASSGSAAAEPIPTGLAQQLYIAANTLQYSGNISVIAEEPAGNITPGKVLNITGTTQTAWATMMATIQSIDEDVATGTTNINIGPATHLGPDDLVEMLRSNRSRKLASSFGQRVTGDSTEDDVTSDGYTPLFEIDSGDGETINMAVYDDTGTNQQAIKIDATDIADDSVAHEIKAREVYIAEDDGNGTLIFRKRQILASAPYGAAIIGVPTITPVSPAVLVFDKTAETAGSARWHEVDTDHKVVARNTGDNMDDDWVRIHP